MKNQHEDPQAGRTQAPLPKFVRQFGHYGVTNELAGRGKFAKVFVGYDTRTHRKVAARVASFEDEDPVEESKVLKKLHKTFEKPYVVEFLQKFDNNTHFIMFMEYCEGGSLEELLKKNGPLPVDVARRLFSQVAQALWCMNELRVVHRDLKPANVMLTSRDLATTEVRLIDFGFAKRANFMHSVKGSPAYMAPERINHERYGFGAEIYSAGIILFEMIYGYQPFERATSVIALYQTQTDFDLPAEPVIPPDAQDILRRCLQVDPLARPSVEALLKHPFLAAAFEAAGGGPLSTGARRSSPSPTNESLTDVPAVTASTPVDKAAPATAAAAAAADEDASQFPPRRGSSDATLAPDTAVTAVGSPNQPAVPAKANNQTSSSSAASPPSPGSGGAGAAGSNPLILVPPPDSSTASTTPASGQNGVGGTSPASPADSTSPPNLRTRTVPPTPQQVGSEMDAPHTPVQQQALPLPTATTYATNLRPPLHPTANTSFGGVVPPGLSTPIVRNAGDRAAAAASHRPLPPMPGGLGATNASFSAAGGASAMPTNSFGSDPNSHSRLNNLAVGSMLSAPQGMGGAGFSNNSYIGGGDDTGSVLLEGAAAIVGVCTNPTMDPRERIVLAAYAVAVAMRAGQLLVAESPPPPNVMSDNGSMNDAAAQSSARFGRTTTTATSTNFNMEGGLHGSFAQSRVGLGGANQSFALNAMSSISLVKCKCKAIVADALADLKEPDATSLPPQTLLLNYVRRALLTAARQEYLKDPHCAYGPVLDVYARCDLLLALLEKDDALADAKAVPRLRAKLADRIVAAHSAAGAFANFSQGELYAATPSASNLA